MSLAIEKVFATPKNYRGCIKYALLQTKSGVWKVEKRRPYGWKSHSIPQDEADWCDNRKRAAALWYYHDMIGTASWWGGEIIHPMRGKEWTLSAVEACQNKIRKPQPTEATHD